MTNPTGLKLTYGCIDPVTEDPNKYKPQPVQVKLKGNKTMTKLVPVTPLVEHDKCIGCIAESNFNVHPRIDCFQLPACDNTIYVRASPNNLVRHIAWRLENDK